MGKWLICAVVTTAMLSGCSTVQQGSIPVTNSASSLAADDQLDGSGGGGYRAPTPAPQAQSEPEDSGVVVMVPGGGASSPIQSYPDSGAGQSAPITTGPLTTGPAANAGTYNVPSTPSGIPSGGGLAADEQLDGPVLALLSTAQRQQSGGDLNGASSSLERAQRIAPREPQVLYRLAEVRLAQGDAAQAEQLARRGLTLAGGRPTLQASFWNLIAQSRERQGDAAGAAQAREKARVNI